MKICAIILTKNEEQNILMCLKSVQWCDEVLVIDDNSTDKTVKLAEKFGARVFTHSLENDFSQQRNFALQKTHADWVVFIDADEKISEALQGEISQRIHVLSDVVGYYIKRRDFLWGKELRHGEVGNKKLLRLAKKNSGQWQGMIHETWEVKGKTGELINALHHYPHQTLKEFLQEINFYTYVRAAELFEKKKRVVMFSVVLYPLGKFVVNFVLKGGLLDGIPGLLVALLMSFHSFLVRSRLWLLWNKK